MVSSDPNKGFHYNPLPLPPKFRSAKRNFASVDATFRQDDSEISFDSTKIRERFDETSWRNFVEFRENKERKTPNFVCISFAQYCILT